MHNPVLFNKLCMISAREQSRQAASGHELVSKQAYENEIKRAEQASCVWPRARIKTRANLRAVLLRAAVFSSRSLAAESDPAAAERTVVVKLRSSCQVS
jgi:hypothetical protein